jgi:uncharacterized protein (DUF1330 family)
MSYYFMANIRIEDIEEYQKYLDQAGQIFSKYNGKYLAIDNQTRVMEGSWDYSRAVLIRFNSEEDFNAWYQSEEYQQILQHRLKAATCDTILIKGK